MRKSKARPTPLPLPTPPPSRSSIRILAPVLVAVVSALAFLPVLRNGFVSWDDYANLVNNPSFRGLGPRQLHWMWTTFHLGHYVPLTWMTLGLDYSLWGLNPTGYHLTNLLLHVVNVLLVYQLAARLLPLAAPGRPPSDILLGAAFAALLFGVHPLRVESVAWATERRDVLSLCFALASVLAYLRFQRAHARRWYLLSILLFAAGLLSKATVISLPVVLLILDVYPLRRIGGANGWLTASARRVYLEKLPFVALSLGAAALSVVALHPGEQLPVAAKLAVSAYGLAFYALKTVVPVGLAPLYPLPLTVHPTEARFIVSAVVAALLLLAPVVAHRRFPGAAAAWVAFVVVTLPMLGAVQNGTAITADRYTYHSGPAMALTLVALIAAFDPLRRARTASLAAAGLVVAALSILTWRQTLFWHDSRTLWTRSLAISPDSYVAHNDLGVVLVDEGAIDEGIAECRAALAINPFYRDAENNLGSALVRRGDVAGALPHYERAHVIDPKSIDVLRNLGNTYYRANDFHRAASAFETAISLATTDARIYTNYGITLLRLDLPDSAVVQFRHAIALDSGSVDARRLLDRVTAIRGR